MNTEKSPLEAESQPSCLGAVICRDIYNHLCIIENYLKGEHNHETDAIQQKEDWELYQETRRLKEALSNHGL
jgi:hypothetical protein